MMICMINNIYSTYHILSLRDLSISFSTIYHFFYFIVLYFGGRLGCFEIIPPQKFQTSRVIFIFILKSGHSAVWALLREGAKYSIILFKILPHLLYSLICFKSIFGQKGVFPTVSQSQQYYMRDPAVKRPET